MLTADVRFEGWTTEDWLRFLRLWQPRGKPELEPIRPRGGVVLVHQDGAVLKLLHTHRGRLDPASVVPPEEQRDTRALALRADHPEALGAIARCQRASWALGMRLGALDEVMERLGARLRRGDDLTTQSLVLIGILREMIAEGAITAWPERLRGLPVPTPRVIHRTVDTVCADGRAIALGLFDDGGLWTAFVARRRGFAFDVIAGPDELRESLGLLSGDWRRDYRHVAAAVEERYAPLGLGCFAELDTFRALQTDPNPGAWSRAVAVRDVIMAPMPAAVGLALGFDGVRYALRGLRVLTGRIMPFAIVGPLLDAARARIGNGAGRNVAAQLGFDPMAVLRALLER
ncbi:MAG: hypothetical protein ACLP1X_05930 [Polyangiaceae bacterium]